MINSVPYLALLMFSVFCIPQSADADTQIPPAIARALSDPRRPPEQVELDAARKPAQLMAFAQMKRGARVADFMPGNAYFTRLMSDVVGTKFSRAPKTRHRLDRAELSRSARFFHGTRGRCRSQQKIFRCPQAWRRLLGH